MEQEESRDLGGRCWPRRCAPRAWRCPATTRPRPRLAAADPLERQQDREDLFTDIGLGRKIATIVATRLVRLLAEDGIRPTRWR
jgi:hypothetical protein